MELPCLLEVAITYLNSKSVVCSSPHLSPEKDIFLCIVHLLHHPQRAFKLKLIQVQYLISFFIMDESGLVDSFWLDYRNYLPKRLFNTYRVKDMEEEKKENFRATIEKRIVSLFREEQ